jgi:pantoate kinase
MTCEDAADDRSGRAFAPGHVTAFFSAHDHENPARAGSRGGGVTLSDGVTVTVSDVRRTGAGTDASATGSVALNGERVGVEPVARVLADLGVTAEVTAESPLPLGTGFGVSGGLALGTAYAVADAVETGLTENDLVRLAHVAEVVSETGLGDVVAQARGGVPLRVEPGAPGHGRLDGIPARARIEYVTFGELSTEAVLSGDTEQLTRAGEAALDRVREAPTLPTLFAAGRTFAREADLVSPTVAETIEAVSAAGGEATMAMLGRTVVALGDGLSAAGYDATACLTHPAGATLVPSEEASPE